MADPSLTTPPAANDLSDLHCPDCDYWLRGLTSDRCPECGFELEALRSPVSRIPWERSEVRGLGCYWKTVLHLVQPSKRLRFELYRQLNERAGRRFVWLTGVWLTVSAALSLGLSAAIPRGVSNQVPPSFWVAAIIEVVLLFPTFLVFQALARDCVRFGWLSPRIQTNAATLLDYAVGPFAWLAPAWLVLAGLCAWTSNETLSMAFPVLAIIFLIGAMVLWFLTVSEFVASAAGTWFRMGLFFAHVLLNWLLLLILVIAILVALGFIGVVWFA